MTAHLTHYDMVTERAGGLLDLLIRAGDSDKEAGTTFFVASTDDEDRAGDVVRQQWSLRNFRANPVILDNHNAMRVVGRGDGWKVPTKGDNAGQLVGTVRWDLDNPDPSIRAIGHQHLNGFRSAGSVGFRAGKSTQRDKLATDHPHFSEGREIETPWGTKARLVGRYFERNELLEFSSATIPMNAAALQQNALIDELSGLDEDDTGGRLLVVGQTIPRAVAADLMSMARALGDDARRELATLLLPDVLAAMRASADDTRRTLGAIRGMATSNPVPATEPTSPWGFLVSPESGMETDQ